MIDYPLPLLPRFIVSRVNPSLSLLSMNQSRFFSISSLLSITRIRNPQKVHLLPLLPALFQTLLILLLLLLLIPDTKNRAKTILTKKESLIKTIPTLPSLFLLHLLISLLPLLLPVLRQILIINDNHSSLPLLLLLLLLLSIPQPVSPSSHPLHLTPQLLTSLLSPVKVV